MCQLLLALTLALVPASTFGWVLDWELDTEMAVLDQPVRRPIILPYGDGRQRGIPQSPFYKQQPAAAHGDFRQLLPASGNSLTGRLPDTPDSGGSSNPRLGDSIDIPAQVIPENPNDPVEIPAQVIPEKPNDPGSGSAEPEQPPGYQPPGPQLTPPDMGGPIIPLPPISGIGG